MKKIFSSILISLFIFSGCQRYNYQGTFSYEPIQPNNSEEILIKYLGADTKLNNAASIDATIYQYGVNLIKTSEIPMQKVDNGWVANFTPDSSSTGVIITFKSGEIIDNNNSLGYLIYFNDNAGKTLPGAIAGHYVALSQWGTWYANLKSDNLSTIIKFEDVFTQYPETKNKYLDFYLYTLSRIGTEKALGKIADELSLLKNKVDLSEDDLIVLAKYSSILKNDNDTQKYEKLIYENYSNSKYIQQIETMKMGTAKSAEELRSNFKEIRKKYPNSELNAISSYRVLRRFIDDGETEGAIKAAEELKAISHPYAFVYSATKLLSQNDLQSALKISQIGVESTQMNGK